MSRAGDIYLVQELLGHKNVSTTQRYLGVNYADARAAVEKMAVEVLESYRTDKMSDSFKLLGSELKTIADETLVLELALRGYDLTQPLRPDTQEHTETAEIVKIGEPSENFLA